LDSEEKGADLEPGSGIRSTVYYLHTYLPPAVSSGRTVLRRGKLVGVLRLREGGEARAHHGMAMAMETSVPHLCHPRMSSSPTRPGKHSSPSPSPRGERGIYTHTQSTPGPQHQLRPSERAGKRLPRSNHASKRDDPARPLRGPGTQPAPVAAPTPHRDEIEGDTRATVMYGRPSGCCLGGRMG